jgi:hypothetical protein
MKIVLTVIVLIVTGILIHTTPPTVYMNDSGETAAAAYTLGIGHPPGYPIYMLALKIFSFAPAGEIAFRMNLLAVLFAVLTLLMFYLNASYMLEKIAGEKDPVRRRIVSLSLPLIYVFSGVSWLQSVQIKGGIYGMEHFFILAVVFCVLKYVFESDKRYLYMGFFLSGILPVIHHTAILITIIAAAVLLFSARQKKAAVKRAAWLLFALSFLTPYLYIFIRAWHAEIRWADIGTVREVFGHITRAVYIKSDPAPLTAGSFFGKLLHYSVEFLKNYSFMAVFALWGIFSLYKKARMITAVFVLFFFLNLTGLFYVISVDPARWDAHLYTEFYLVNDLFLFLAALFGVKAALDLIGNKQARTAAASALLLAPAAFLFLNYGANDHERTFLAYDHAENIFKTLKGGEIVFGRVDADVFNMQYEKHVLKKYGDIHAFDLYGNVLDAHFQRSMAGSGEFTMQRTETFESGVAMGNPGMVYYTEQREIRDQELRTEPYGILNKLVKVTQQAEGTDKLMEIYSIRDMFGAKNMDYRNRIVLGGYFVRKAEYAAMQNDMPRFESWRRAAENIARDVPDVIKSIASIYLHEMHDPANCAVYLEKSIALNPYFFSALNLLTRLYYDMGMYDKSLKWVEFYYDREWNKERKKMVLQQVQFIKDSMKNSLPDTRGLDH